MARLKANRLSLGQRLERTVPGGFEHLASGTQLPNYHWAKKQATIVFIYFLAKQGCSLLKHDFPKFSAASDIFGPFSALNLDRKLLQ
jgi:hypothetical protein